MSLEQEIKLVINQTEQLDLQSMAWLTQYSQGKIVTSHLVSTYFDTKEQHLRNMEVGLRMRQYDGQWMQTVKTSGIVEDGLHQRDEWEHDLKSPEWDLEKLKQTPLKMLIEQELIWSQLAELFTTDFIRQTMQLRFDDGTQIELAYDCGEVRCGSVSDIIHEIELELKSGSVEQLKLLAEQLCSHLSVNPSDISKAQQGYQLAQKNLNLASR